VSRRRIVEEARCFQRWLDAVCGGNQVVLPVGTDPNAQE